MCHSGKLSNLQCVMKNLLLFYIVLFWSSLSVQAQYSLQGDGVDMGSNCYQLTAETTNQMGSIWYEELIDLNDTFELQFTMNVVCVDIRGPQVGNLSVIDLPGLIC